MILVVLVASLDIYDISNLVASLDIYISSLVASLDIYISSLVASLDIYDISSLSC